MAEVEAPLSPPAPQEEVLSEGADLVDAQPETDGEHEATDVVGAPSDSEAAGSVAEAKPSENGENGVSEESDAPVDEITQENAKEAASPPTTPSKKITAKSSIFVKSSSASKVSGSPTPLVKKVCCHSCLSPFALPMHVCSTRLVSRLRRLAQRPVDHQLWHVRVWHS